MKVKWKNSSSRKTKDKIKMAFASLLKEKGELNKVTVTDIVKIADITRASFYTHFDNVYDIAKELQNETLDILYNNIKDKGDIRTINNYFDEIISYLKVNEEIYTMILTSDDPTVYTLPLNRIITKSLKDILNSFNIIDLDLKITLFVDGCMDIVIKYFRKEINYSLDEINIFFHNTFKILFLQEKNI